MSISHKHEVPERNLLNITRALFIKSFCETQNIDPNTELETCSLSFSESQSGKIPESRSWRTISSQETSEIQVTNRQRPRGKMTKETTHIWCPALASLVNISQCHSGQFTNILFFFQILLRLFWGDKQSEYNEIICSWLNPKGVAKVIHIFGVGIEDRVGSLYAAGAILEPTR